MTFRQNRHPGSFVLLPRHLPGLFDFESFCPCGCVQRYVLLIGDQFKPGGDRPSWRWNGSRTEPTLDPPVHHVGHWHGWLRDGYWRAA